jgi:hypothetical protein
MRDTIDMAREAGFMLRAESVEGLSDWWECFDEEIERLVALVRADERERVMNEPLTKAQWQRFEDEIRADERDVVEGLLKEYDMVNSAFARDFRARGNT